MDKKGIKGIGHDDFEAWAKKYGKENVKIIEVKNGDEVVTGVIVLPHALGDKALSIYSKCFQYYAQNKLLECGQFILNNCWLGGDGRLIDKNNVRLFVSAAITATGLIDFLEADVKDVL